MFPQFAKQEIKLLIGDRSELETQRKQDIDRLTVWIYVIIINFEILTR